MNASQDWHKEDVEYYNSDLAPETLLPINHSELSVCDGHLGSNARSQAFVLLTPKRNLLIKGPSMHLLSVNSRQKGFDIYWFGFYVFFAGYLSPEIFF